MALLGLAEFICLIGIPITLAGFIIQSVRKKKNKVIFGMACIYLWAGLIICVGISFFIAPSKDTESEVSSSISENLQNSEREEVNEESEVIEESVAEQEDMIDTSVTYAEIYREYKKNELRADEIYQYNRYRITAKINGIKTGGLLNLTGGATLTMEIRVDNTIVFFYAEFEKEQEEALKSLNVGDTITFEGKCLSASTWTDCEIITEQ